MTTAEIASLEKIVEKWIVDLAEDSSYEGYFYNDLVPDMTKAAVAIFDASMNAQKFAKEQE